MCLTSFPHLALPTAAHSSFKRFIGLILLSPLNYTNSSQHFYKHMDSQISKIRLTLLGQEQPVSLLQRHPMSRVLVIRRKSRRVSRLGHFARNDLVQRVNALAIGINGVHKMHFVRYWVLQRVGGWFEKNSRRYQHKSTSLGGIKTLHFGRIQRSSGTESLESIFCASVQNNFWSLPKARLIHNGTSAIKQE